MSNHFLLETVQYEDHLTWLLTGNLTMEETSELRKRFYAALQHERSLNLKMDFSRLKIMDASGISMLVSFQNALKKRHGSLKLNNVPPHILAIFEKTNLILYFDIQHK
jgi:anti-anti-sigma factor